MKKTEYGLVSGNYEDWQLSQLDREMFPMMIHRCGEYECREKIPIKYRYCDRHWKIRHEQYEKQQRSPRRQQRYDAYKRDEQSKAFYHSKPWMKTRDYVYARDGGTCKVCGNVVTDRKIVDHIVALKLDRSKGLDVNNLWTLCYRCHSRKTKLETKMINDEKEQILRHLNTKWWTKVLKEEKQ